MNEEETKVEIAKAVCTRFINLRQPTSRHALLVEFQNRDILNEMESRNLLQPNEARDGYLPTIGTFSLLGDDHELYQLARDGFERTVYALWNLFCARGPNVHHVASEVEPYSDQLYREPAKEGAIKLGLYLACETGAVQAKMSDNRMSVEELWINETVINMKDPKPWWDERIRASREPLRRQGIPIDQFFADLNPLETECSVEEAYRNDDFWTVIHQEVAAQARSRFGIRQYADAVEAALKVVAEKVRTRTKLELDGAALMHKAFAPKRPYLKFEDPMPATQDSMQQGYMEMFAGAMTGVRNPKAHALVKLERERCIHFLFLASLLAYKVDDAVDAQPTEETQKSAPAPKPDLASLNISVGKKGMSGEVRTVSVSAVIENISSTKRITEYNCTLSVPSSCLTFQTAVYSGEIKSNVARRRSFRRTEVDEGATKVVFPGEQMKVYSIDLGIDQLKLKGTWMEGDFETALNDEVTLEAVVQGEKIQIRKPIREIFEGMT